MENRHLKTTAFERTADGYVYYESAWAKGVPVTAEERELYLSGARIEWFSAILDREKSEPRRAYWQTFRRMVHATVLGFDPAEKQLTRER